MYIPLTNIENLHLQVSESLEFLDQVKGAAFLTESVSRHPSTKDIQKDVFTHTPQFQLNSSSATEGLVSIKAEADNTRLLEDTITVDSLKNFSIASSNHSLHSFNGFTYNESCSGLNPHIVAMPVNSKSINTVKVFQSDSNLRNSNISENAQQIKSTIQPGFNLASAATSYSSLANLPRIEHELSSTPNMLRHCQQNDRSTSFLDSYTSMFSTDTELKSTLFDNDTPFGQSDVIQKVGTTGSTSYACELHELPNEIWGEATGATKPVKKQDSENNGFLESSIFDPDMHDLWDDTALLAGNTSHFSATGMNSVAGQASSDPLSVEERVFFSGTIFEELLGFDNDISTVMASTDPLAGPVSDCRLPRYNPQDSFSACNSHVAALKHPSISCTSENIPNGEPKATPVSLQNLSMDDCVSLNTANSKVSQVKNPEGAKVVKKRARPGESMRPRPKDRQQIQERVKELREIVPNSAKVRIGHNIFLCV
jgi:hypothetical protein